MKYLLKSIFLLLFLVVVQLASAQSLLRFIPSDATFVMSLDPAHLNQKVSIDKLEQLDVYKFLVDNITNEAGGKKALMEQVINDPRTIGLDFKKSASYAAFNIGANNSMSGQLVMKVSDASKFEQFLNEQANNGAKMALEQQGGMSYTLMGSDLAIGWDNEKVIFYSGQSSPAKDEPYRDFMARKDQAFKKNFLSVLSLSPTRSILRNGKYMAARAKGNDAHIWMDYGPIMEMSQSFLGNAGPLIPGSTNQMNAEMMNALSSLYDDMKISASMNFEKGAMTMNTKTFMGGKLMDYSKKAYKRKLNRDFYKYIKKENLMAYFSLATDSKAMWGGMKDMMYPMIEKMGEEGSMAVSALKIMEIAIDEDALYDLLKGDVVFAVTGLKDFETSYKSFEYDKEFNKKEVTKTRKTQLPEFVMMLSYGDESNINKFFRLGQQAKVLEAAGRNAYKISNLPAEFNLGMDMYVAINDGVLMFTNDATLVNQYLRSGVPSSSRIAGVHKKRLKKNASVLYWDIPSTLKHLPDGPMGDEATQQIMNMSKNSLKNFEMTIKRPKRGYMEQDLRFNFFNDDVNALEQLMNFVNDIYISATNEGKSM